ncbi:hypothetical protein HOT99_gp274 [Caulobacter phage CcrBL10]|uniref:Uncharacterized protein n=1 Tax=Caulobacter phage CcrBL10 TaxID=2283269 RepID=A0A385E963_9CAUD|nr:hypothetical protein HOT99_gp274 [Caulobacter phage CcrBL10]AXQ68343.1 hypothetical protein CcrBL10_gp139c [Caulobacter phage CcrBL10]
MTPHPSTLDPAEAISPEEKAAYLEAVRDKYPPDAIAVLDQAISSGSLSRQDLQSGAFEMSYGRGTEADSTNNAFADEGQMNRRQRRRAQAAQKGKTKTSSLDKMFAKLVASGDVRIVRERGKPPRVVWL